MAEAEIPDVEEIEEYGKVPFTKRIAQTTALYAVVLAIASLGGNNAMKEMLIAQQQASNQWAYYQAKVIRENIYRVEKDKLELTLAERGEAMTPAVRSRYEKQLDRYRDAEKRYGNEKKQIREIAKGHESIRDRSQSQDPYFDYAEVLLQIAIVMASVAILAQARKVFYFSIAFAVLATLLTINGFGLFVDVPFL